MPSRLAMFTFHLSLAPSSVARSSTRMVVLLFERSALLHYFNSLLRSSQFVKMSTLLISGNMQQPGVMFSYDFTPMEIEVRVRNRG